MSASTLRPLCSPTSSVHCAFRSVWDYCPRCHQLWPTSSTATVTCAGAVAQHWCHSESSVDYWAQGYYSNQSFVYPVAFARMSSGGCHWLSLARGCSPGFQYSSLGHQYFLHHCCRFLQGHSWAIPVPMFSWADHQQSAGCCCACGWCCTWRYSVAGGRDC